MLKITKGLRPFVKDGITPYTDVQGNRYVRVKVDGEDFCIAAHSYTEDHYEYYKSAFTRNNAMEILNNDRLTMFTKKQILIYIDYLDEVYDKFEEIGGEALVNEWYWVSDESDPDKTWYYEKDTGNFGCRRAYYITCRVRPILNL